MSLFVAVSAFGQKGKQGDVERQIKSKKIAFITEKLELTPEEAERFWPLYNVLEDERSEIHKERRENNRKYRKERESMSDSEFLDFANKIVELQLAEGKLAEQYNKKFQKILPPEKVVRLYLVEGRFRAHLMKEYSERRRSGHGNGNGKKK
jgi:hypothetical protein